MAAVAERLTSTRANRDAVTATGHNGTARPTVYLDLSQFLVNVYLEAYRSGHNGTDSKSVVPHGTVGSNPTASAKKIRQVLTCRIFLSKPQAWHIIKVVNDLVSHHAPACISLRLDDIQRSALMIYRNKLQ